jgi:phage shock protein C
MSKKLYRSSKDKMIGGVAAGLAEYFDIDPTLIRVLFVITLFLGGTGILAYILLWIIVPEEPIVIKGQQNTDQNQSSSEQKENTQSSFDAQAYVNSIQKQRENRRVFAGIILVVLGLIFLADNFIPRIRFGDFWPIILIAIGIAVLLNARRRNQT